MKEWKLWKVILLLFVSYFVLNIIILLAMFGISGQIGDLFGSSDSVALWMNYVFGHSLASPSVKILFTVNEFNTSFGWMIMHNVHFIVPGVICSILVAIYSRNSRIAFFVPFLFFLSLSTIIIILEVAGIPLISIAMLEELVPIMATASAGIVIPTLIFIGLLQSIFYGAIAGLTRNILSM